MNDLDPNDPFDDDKFDWLDWLSLSTAVLVLLGLVYIFFGKSLYNLIHSLL